MRPSLGIAMTFAPLVALAGCASTAIHPQMLPALRVGGWINDRAVSANELTGKVVVLDFWAPW